MKPLLTAALSGLLFSLGLGLSGMAHPAKVLAFLDVLGDWDPSLALVMAGALGTYAALRRWVLRRPRPLAAAAFPSPPPRRLDAPVAIGAAIFGVGWGLSGYCPGPAFTSLAAGAWQTGLFVAAMAAGMFLHRLLPAKAQQQSDPTCG
jgi:uncharacterized membrane protein YedE/YeeE